MSTVNKKSVRDEVDRLKADFKKLCFDKKITTECRVLMKNMFMLIELIVSIFLEKTTKKNSKNSSMPPSQSDEDETIIGKTNGKGNNPSINAANNTKVTETVTTISVETCEVCGQDLTDVPCTHHERRTTIDIIFEKTVEHVDVEIKDCPNCSSTIKGDFPPNMHGPRQYGPGIKAYIINLLVCQMVSLNRVQKLIKSMIGEAVSEATMLKFILRLHEALSDWELAAIDTLINSVAINVDETSLKVDKKNHWVHVHSAGPTTLKFIHQKRGCLAIESINIIPRYGGVIIHDCWASYLSYKHCGHGLCGSHILRELTFIVESNNYQWAKNMKRLLQETCKVVSKRKRKKITTKEYTNLQKRYRNILTRGEKELPEIPPNPSGRKGKIAKSDAHNLWERLKKHESAVLLFSVNANVSFTNNRAERDLRMTKVKQKVSGCFRTALYAQAYCRISSYIQTMANKGYNPLVAIQIALAGEIDLKG